MRYALVADLISRDRYKKIRTYLDLADNTMKDNPGNTGNKLYKVVIDHVKKIVTKLNQNSISPQMNK